MPAAWTIIGSGRLGSALRQWLGPIGVPATVVRHAGVAAWRRGLRSAAPGGLLLAVPDDALAGLGRDLAAARPEWRGWRVLHTSGGLDSSVLAPLQRRGAAVGSLHPMMTFPRAGRPAPAPEGIVFSYEGDPGARRAAAALIRDWRGLPLPLAPGVKTAYHLAATLVGPGAVVEMAAAETVLRRAGLRGAQLARARQGLRRLLGATAANLEDGLLAAWTGPWARGDRQTVARHLRQVPTPELRRLYRALLASARADEDLSSGTNK
ncbi:MAG TPA: Rossmann-like and DUF2520 domain-containing protein [Terriglobales bacterium]|jgi:predicted short-subunit dehydrogenase-like oxidoreductase (DUF2520 family)